MIDLPAMRKKLLEEKQRYLKVVQQYGLASEQAREAFVELSMAVYGNARKLESASNP